MFGFTAHQIRLGFATAIVVGVCMSPDRPAEAQFGGLQDMMLQKQRQQQAQVTANGNNPSQSIPGAGNQQQPQVNNNYYIEVPSYNPYGNYNGYPPVNPYAYGNGAYGYGYGNTYGNGYQPANPYTYGYGNSNNYNNGYGNSFNNNAFSNNGFGNSGLPVAPITPFNHHRSPVSAAPVQPQAEAAAWPPTAQQPQAELQTDEHEIARRVAGFKPSSDVARARADQLIADGDREFAGQQYRRAAAKYREAITKAPDYAPGHLHAGHAYIATGDYELAVNYLAMGFALSRTIERPGFSLADLYRGDDLAKANHNEALADAVLRQPEDGGLLFLTGIVQHYDGHPLQARDYFRRAAAIPGRHRPYAEMFLPQADAAK